MTRYGSDEKGAFTGAVSQHDGVFVRAHGGTFFVDAGRAREGRDVGGVLPGDAKASRRAVLVRGAARRREGVAPGRVRVARPGVTGPACRLVGGSEFMVGWTCS
ncbi:sigma 54-interacting transcriptional regulator [Nannocystis bainbridge]|uniref:sigma 54-interacting transcriptional regulator n=1 Tax=Nannocystis bainbridge TaxID=2995303 RepID=UPI00358DA2D5